MKAKSESELAQSCPTLRDPKDCSLPGSPDHGIFQARVLEWGAMSSLETGKLEFVKCFDCSLHGLLLAPSFLRQSLFQKGKQQGDVPGIHIQNLT